VPRVTSSVIDGKAKPVCDPSGSIHADHAAFLSQSNTPQASIALLSYYFGRWLLRIEDKILAEEHPALLSIIVVKSEGRRLSGLHPEWSFATIDTVCLG
jgi:hypothetical protein